MVIDKKKVEYLLFTILLIILAPNTLAFSYNTGISPLNRGFEAIGDLFNIEVLRTNTGVQQGFLKFMFFIVLFAVANMALKKTKIFDNKTAGIVSFAFSTIGVFMMPIEWLNATGGLVTVIMSSIVFLGFFLGLAVVAVFVLRKKGDDDKMGWIKNLLGFILLLMLITLLDDFAIIANVPILLFVKEEWFKKIMEK